MKFWEESLTKKYLKKTKDYFNIIRSSFFIENTDYFLANEKFTIHEFYIERKFTIKEASLYQKLNRWTKRGVFTAWFEKNQKYYSLNKNIFLMSLKLSGHIYDKTSEPKPHTKKVKGYSFKGRGYNFHNND